MDVRVYVYTFFFFICEFVDRRFFTYLIHALLVDASIAKYIYLASELAGELFFLLLFMLWFSLAFGGGEWGDGMNEESSFLDRECACAFWM